MLATGCVGGGVGECAGSEASQQKHQSERGTQTAVIDNEGSVPRGWGFGFAVPRGGFLSGDLESQNVYTFCR